MKKVILAIVFFASIASCKKKEQTNNSAQKCDWFPIYRGITYNGCVHSNSTPPELHCHTETLNGAVTDSSFRLGEMLFTLADCNNGKIYFHQGPLPNILLIDNSASPASQTIYDDGIYMVTQHKDAADFIYSTVKNIAGNYEIIRVQFIAGKGLYTIDEIHKNSGRVIFSHTLNE